MTGQMTTLVLQKKIWIKYLIFMMNEFNDNDDQNLTEAKAKKNKPKNPKLWSQCLSWAKSRYKVCPSAYCNGAAAKRYKQLGGKWKKE